VRVSSAPPTHDEGVPTMPAVMDAVVDAFGRVFGLEMLDADRGGGQPPAQGGRIAVPRSR